MNDAGRATAGLPAATAGPDLPPQRSSGPDFSPLTAFAGSDSEAARSILTSFVEQTSANCTAFEQALAGRDDAAVKALSHKMLPIFTMLRAEALADTLRRTETSETPLPETLREALQGSVATIRAIVDAARRQVAENPSAEAPRSPETR